MPSLSSPGVLTNEIDLTTIVPSVATTDGAIAGVFRWGPVDKSVIIASEDLLAARYGTPTNFNPETWFSAASFLAYSNRLHVSRAADTTGNNFTKIFDGNSTNFAMAGGNNFLQCNNTTGLTEGMILFYADAAGIPEGATVSSVNSTGVILSEAATSNVEDVVLIFREDIAFSAVAQQSDLSYTAVDVSDWDAQIVKSDDHYEERIANGETFDVSVLYAARYPGEMGNSLRVAVCDTPSQFHSNTTLITNSSINSTASKIQANVGSNTVTVTVAPADTSNGAQTAVANATAGSLHASLTVGDKLEFGNTRLGLQYLQIKAIGTVTNTANVYSFTLTMDDSLKLAANVSMNSMNRFWEFYGSVDAAPEQSDYVLSQGNTSANDELHVVVVDELGKFSGSPGAILETYRNLSRASDAKSADGATIYYKDVINQRSQYIWWANDRTTARSNTAPFITSSTATKPLNMTMIGGADGKNEANVSLGTLTFAWDKFKSAEDIDVSLLIQGKARGESITHFTQLGNWIVDNIAEHRKDCVAFLSPHYNDVVNNRYEEATDIVDWRQSCRDSSYYFPDSGYKWMYDRYNDVNRYIPLCGDMAGLAARTDQTNDPWFSIAGFNRGQVKNLIKLPYNPRQTDRDTLFRAGVNPVVTFPGQGTILYGDKTGLSKPSAFDAIGVRRMFIVLRKSISKAAQSSLFEFNDEFTRAQFKNMIVPYLRDVQGRRGITDFIVVCDETNNTPEVIDRNEFIGDIYIKPARSIRYIILNFVAVRTGVAFSEVVGRF
jgi:hypothetical protein